MRPLLVWSIALAATFPMSFARGQDRPRTEGETAGQSRPPETLARRSESIGPRSAGLAALQRASAANKFLFLFFWKDKDPRTTSLWGVYQSTMTRLADRSDAVAIRVDDATEKAIVDRFGAAGAPLPLVLAVAPNGAVTRGFPGTFDEAQLASALVSSGTARCLKALQDRKLVLLSVQHLSAASNPITVPVGLVAFQKDPSYAQVTEIVVINAGDAAETSFLKGLGSILARRG